MSDCRFGVSPVNYPDPENLTLKGTVHLALLNTAPLSFFLSILFSIKSDHDGRCGCGTYIMIRILKGVGSGTPVPSTSLRHVPILVNGD